MCDRTTVLFRALGAQPAIIIINYAATQARGLGAPRKMKQSDATTRIASPQSQKGPWIEAYPKKFDRYWEKEVGCTVCLGREGMHPCVIDLGFLLRYPVQNICQAYQRIRSACRALF
jgi:hypothetical protein